MLNDGDGYFIDSGLRLGNGNSKHVSLGDLDGDGDLDAFISNVPGDDGQAANEVWLNESQVDAFAPGDATRDGAFDQLDIVHLLQAGKYQTGEPAEWSEGDFTGDGVFDQIDIITALHTGTYLQ